VQSVGRKVTVHHFPITQSGWTGTGYIITDPATGAGAYKISGGANGAILIMILAGILIIVSVLPFFLIVAVVFTPIIALIGATVISWGIVLFEIQQLDHGPLRGILADLAYGAFGIALTGLTGSAVVSLIAWIVFSIANYYISSTYLRNIEKEYV
jgi:hypothetical protein